MSARGTTSGRARGASRILVVAEVALALVLVVGAGLMVKSLLNLEQQSSGFQPAGLLTFELRLPSARYPDGAAAPFFERMMEELRAVPGVQGAGAINFLPLANFGFNGGFAIEGRPTKPVPQTTTRFVPESVTAFTIGGIGFVASSIADPNGNDLGATRLYGSGWQVVERMRHDTSGWTASTGHRGVTRYRRGDRAAAGRGRRRRGVHLWRVGGRGREAGRRGRRRRRDRRRDPGGQSPTPTRWPSPSTRPSRSSAGWTSWSTTRAWPTSATSSHSRWSSSTGWSRSTSAVSSPPSSAPFRTSARAAAIINIGSINADRVPGPGLSVYAMTKGGRRRVDAWAGARPRAARHHGQQRPAGTHRDRHEPGRGRIRRCSQSK